MTIVINDTPTMRRRMVPTSTGMLVFAESLREVRGAPAWIIVGCASVRAVLA